MTLKIQNPVSKEISRLSKKFGLSTTSIASRAFKNSRKADQLERRDKGDINALEKLSNLEAQLEKDRHDKVAKLFPKQSKVDV